MVLEHLSLPWCWKPLKESRLKKWICLTSFWVYLHWTFLIAWIRKTRVFQTSLLCCKDLVMILKKEKQILKVWSKNTKRLFTNIWPMESIDRYTKKKTNLLLNAKVKTWHKALRVAYQWVLRDLIKKKKKWN